MPASKQSGALKVALPLIAAVILLTMVFASVITGGGSSGPSQQQQQQQQQQPADAVADPERTAAQTAAPETAEAPGPDGTPEPSDPEPATAASEEQTEQEQRPVAARPEEAPEVDAPALSAPDDADLARLSDGWRVRVIDGGASLASIGSIDPDTRYEMELAFERAGAGLNTVTFTNHFDTAINASNARRGSVVPESQYVITSERPSPAGTVRLIMLGARALWVRDPATDVSIFFNMQSPEAWRETAPGAFEAIVEDSAGVAALVVTRRYTLTTESYEISVEQRVENRSQTPLEIAWYQYGPADLPLEMSGYRIDSRRVRVGYTLSNQPQSVLADSKLRELSGVAKDAQQLDDQGRLMSVPKPLWPDKAYQDAGALAWVGQTNRHFLFAVHPLIDRDSAEANLADATANPIDKTLVLANAGVSAEAVVAGNLRAGDAKPEDQHVLLQLRSPAQRLEPGATTDLSFGAYIGPLDGSYLAAANDPVFGVLNLADVIVYQIGFCGFCTFQWIAKPLYWLLGVFEGFLVFDWGLAIILLVICVRAALHPITKRSQVSMMRFSKQMQRIAPMQKKIQERYKDDKKRMQQEMIKLMREERVNYAGMFGCLPMFLQSPIWIALYATIYFAFDLRHTPAFFGVFQQLGGWTFLNDLSSPDHFIEFSSPLFTLPLVGAISGFNILPLLMGAIFYVQQKYMSPPSTGNLSPEQEQTQKLMKVMLVVMMPVFMYNAPSGLTLYILTSSTIGVLESRYIRAHVDQLDLDAPPPPKPSRDAGRKKVANVAAARRHEPRKRFKDRDKG